MGVLLTYLISNRKQTRYESTWLRNDYESLTLLLKVIT